VLAGPDTFNASMVDPGFVEEISVKIVTSDFDKDT
jgi:hypothetical protein